MQGFLHGIITIKSNVNMEKSNHTNPIKFFLGTENAPFIEQNIREAPLFQEQYNALIERVKFYVNRKSEQCVKSSGSIEFANIIAINGDRGTGKTSVMLSFVDHLRKNESEVKETTFLILETIDPSFFSDGSKPLQIIIAQLYKQFKAEFQNYSLEDKNKILRHFAKIKKCLRVIDTKQSALEYNDDIEDLENLSAAVDLRESMKSLIDDILKVQEKNMLLIAVDDIDLNTEYAYDMLEQLRKYFTLPNVLILFAANLEQLKEVVSAHLYKEFSFLLKDDMGKSRIITSSEIVAKAEKYLLKLIPIDNRVTLNNLSVVMNKEMQVVRVDGTVKNFKGAIKIAVLQLIYQKTKYLFLNRADSTSEIIPRNLRELRMLLSSLFAMADVMDPQSLSLLENQTRFKEYFYTIWLPSHLDLEYQQTIQMLKTSTNYSTFNKLVISTLLSIVMNVQGERSSRTMYSRMRFEVYNDVIKRICDGQNTNGNVSLGDVLAVCSYIGGMSTDKQVQTLIFAIKAIYTFKLQDAFQEQITPDELSYYETALKNGQTYYSNYQLLLGGCAINSEYNAFLPSPVGRDWNRLYHTCSLGKFRKRYSNGILFDMLCTLYSWEEGKTNATVQYRRRQQIYYKRDLSQITDIGYDFFAWTYNLPFIFECVKRFDSSINILEKEAQGASAEFQQALCVALKETPASSQELLGKWIRQICITSVDYIDGVIEYLGRIKFESSSDNKLALYKRIFVEMQNFTEKIETEISYKLPYKIGIDFMLSLLDENDIPQVLQDKDVVKQKRKSISCPLGELRTGGYTTLPLLLKFLRKKNPSMSNESLEKLKDYMQDDMLLTAIEEQNWSDVSKYLKKFKYDVIS